MITLGIDPGFARCGYAFVENKMGQFRIIEASLIETKPAIEYHLRIKTIFETLNDLIEKHKPDNASLESLFFSKNTKTAMQVSETRGVIILLFAKNNLPFKEYNPKEVKLRITGSGNASKESVMKMVKLFTGEDIKQDDTADAVALAITHASENKLLSKLNI